MKMKQIKVYLVLLVFFGSMVGSAVAYDLPAVNLGLTSFVDGGPPAGPGIYLTQYFQYYKSDQLNDEGGNSLGLPDPELDVWVSLSQFLYQSNKKLILGGKWGLDVIIPIVGISLDYSAAGPFPEDNRNGIGDIVIGPYLQWDPIMKNGRPFFMHRVELQFILPTGKYDENKELNPGSNFFSFNPYWSGTLFVTPRWTVSARIHYLWNAKNKDPNRGFIGAAESQAGQALHANFSTAYEVIPKKLRVGINAYVLDQLTETQADGVDVGGRKESASGIGPGALWHLDKNNHIFFNAYYETSAENRPEGNRFIARWVHHF